MNAHDMNEGTQISDSIIADLRKTFEHSFEEKSSRCDGYTRGLIWTSSVLTFCQGSLNELIMQNENNQSFEEIVNDIEAVAKKSFDLFFKRLRAGEFKMGGMKNEE